MALWIGSGMAKGAFQLSEAEAAFHPWWDTLEDYAAYSMILIGKVFNYYLSCMSPIFYNYLDIICQSRSNKLIHRIRK